MKLKHCLGLEIGLLLLGLSANGATVTLTVDEEMQFSPAELVIQAGDIVEFVNTDSRPHSVVGDPSLAKNPLNVVLPPGATPFHSDLLGEGQKYSFTLTVPGNYEYVCGKHEAMGMKGKISVLPATPNRRALNMLPSGDKRAAVEFKCEAYYEKKGVSQIEKFEMISKPEGDYSLVNETILVAGREYGFYIYYDGGYSAINIGATLPGSKEYYNSDAEVVVGKLFSLHVVAASLPEGIESLGVSCH